MPILFGIGIISKDSVIIQGHLHPCTPSVSGVLLECIRKNKDRLDKAGWNQYQVSILRLNTRIQYLNSPRTSGRRRHHVHVCDLQDKRSLLRAQSGSGIFLSGIRDSHAEEFSDSVPYEGNPHTSLCPDRHGVGKDNISPFEFIPWILGQCKNLSEAKTLLGNIRLVNIPFSSQLPITPLHWMIADQNGCIVVESVRDGLHIYDNPVGVMTNNPTFDIQLFRLNDYRGVSAAASENTFAKGLDLDAYSRGMGGIGIPGDLSSGSRFVKVAFTKMNSVSDDSEDSSVSQFFHILGSVEQQRGCCDLGDGKYEITIYSSCCNMDRGIYYYRTYSGYAP